MCRFFGSKEPEKEFIEHINFWFASNPCAANIKCRFDLEQGFGFFANRYVLRSFEIEYELFSTVCSNSYYLFSEEVSSLHRMSVKKYVEDWKAVNPAASVVNWSGGTNARGNIGALCIGFGAANHLNVFMLVKYPRDAYTAYADPACVPSV